MCADNALIQLADEINLLCSQYKNLKQISASQVVVVGEQSAGKSSVVNKLIGFDVLPVGTNIVTRTPIFIKLIRNENKFPKLSLFILGENQIELHKYERNLNSETEDLNQKKIEEFRNKLIDLTNIVAGNGKNISERPIYLNIYWNSFKTNFSFVDLPGRVLITTSDQSKSVKNDIDILITKYLTISNTIALVIMKSKTDLVTDSGLALFKQVEIQTGKSIRAVGILTKPDIMAEEEIHILNDFVMGRLNGAISVTDGYFCVNNKSQNEEQYFNTTFGKESDIVKNEKWGIENVKQYIETHLIKMIKSSLPHVKNEISELLKQKQCEYQSLGGDSFDNKNNSFVANKIIIELCAKLTNSINSKFSKDNVGYKLGESMRKMLVSINKLVPIGNDLETTKYFQNLVKYSRNHKLTSQVSLEEMIKNCINEPKYCPNNIFMKSVITCITEIETEVTSTINKIINSGTIEMVELYPEFKSHLLNLLFEKIHEFCDQTIKEIQKYLEKQKKVIWSTDPSFSSLLKSYYYSFSEKNSVVHTMKIGNAINTMLESFNNNENEFHTFEFNALQVKNICSAYYKTIIERGRDMIYQEIVNGIILKVENDIVASLLMSLSTQNLDKILKEDKNKLLKRNNLKNEIFQINQTLLKASLV